MSYMKVILQPEFLFEYYYLAAKNASDEVQKQQLPYSIHYALTSLFLTQCVFESYANYQIRHHNLEAFCLKRKNGRSIMLPKASIREKWACLPIARGKPHFILNKEPFSHFARLVRLRNAFIHFNEQKLTVEKNAPSTVQTMGDLINWTKTGEFLNHSIYDQAIRYGIAGKLIVRDMFQEYSRLTGDPLPKFLQSTAISIYRVKIRR